MTDVRSVSISEIISHRRHCPSSPSKPSPQNSNIDAIPYPKIHVGAPRTKLPPQPQPHHFHFPDATHRHYCHRPSHLHPPIHLSIPRLWDWWGSWIVGDLMGWQWLRRRRGRMRLWWRGLSWESVGGEGWGEYLLERDRMGGMVEMKADDRDGCLVLRGIGGSNCAGCSVEGTCDLGTVVSGLMIKEGMIRLTV